MNKLNLLMASAVFGLILSPAAMAASGDYIELWQNFYAGSNKPASFKLKIDGTSGWVDMTKETGGGTRKRETSRLKPEQVQAIFTRLAEIGIWTVQPAPVDKPKKDQFLHRGKIGIRQAKKKRTLEYQIDKEYYVEDLKSVSKGLEPKTPMGRIDRYLSEQGLPMRAPVNKTPE